MCVCSNDGMIVKTQSMRSCVLSFTLKKKPRKTLLRARLTCGFPQEGSEGRVRAFERAMKKLRPAKWGLREVVKGTLGKSVLPYLVEMRVGVPGLLRGDYVFHVFGFDYCAASLRKSMNAGIQPSVTRAYLVYSTFVEYNYAAVDVILPLILAQAIQTVKPCTVNCYLDQ